MHNFYFSLILALLFFFYLAQNRRCTQSYTFLLLLFIQLHGVVCCCYCCCRWIVFIFRNLSPSLGWNYCVVLSDFSSLNSNLCRIELSEQEFNVRRYIKHTCMQCTQYTELPVSWNVFRRKKLFFLSSFGIVFFSTEAFKKDVWSKRQRKKSRGKKNIYILDKNHKNQFFLYLLSHI